MGETLCLFLLLFLSCLYLLLFLYKALLWRENVQQREKEVSSCSVVRMAGRDIGKGGKLKLHEGQPGWSHPLCSKNGG